MYPSKYKASVRIHSVDDAITTPIHNKTPADMFLYCLDLYDVCINHMESNTTMQNVSTIKTSLTQFMSDKFIQLNERIPGQMKGWTQGMFVYTCYSGFNTLTTLNTSLNKQWMYDNRLCMTQNMDTTNWSFFTWCKSLDALELQWRNIPKDNTLHQYLKNSNTEPANSYPTYKHPMYSIYPNTASNAPKPSIEYTQPAYTNAIVA